MEDSLSKSEVKEVLSILKEQVERHIPKRINDTILDYRISEEAYYPMHFGFRIIVALFDSKSNSLCEKFEISFTSMPFSYVPVGGYEEFICEAWMPTVDKFITNLIQGLNMEDLTKFKEKLKETY